MDKEESAGRRKNAAIPDHEALKNNEGKAGHEPESFAPKIPNPNDLMGPAGDPAEGRRK